jgi:hypothetical protein
LALWNAAQAVRIAAAAITMVAISSIRLAHRSGTPGSEGWSVMAAA